MVTLLLTGATGFIGKALMYRLLKDGIYSLVVAIRQPYVNLPVDVKIIKIGDLSPNINWIPALDGVDFVIHAAARAHILKETASDPSIEFRRVNVDATLALALQAAQAGCKRFIFISSIGVYGTQGAAPFTEEDAPNPVELYAVSKLEAEQGLRELSSKTGMEVVIIRPVLVYGPKAPGNFGRLMNLVAKGIPLPLGAIHNKRSLVALDNLVDLIVTCIAHPAAANETFLAGDGEDLSTTELLERMGQALGKPARLIPVPVGVLKWLASLLGKDSVVRRLCGSLQVDITKAREVLGWVPPVSVDEGLKKAAKNF